MRFELSERLNTTASSEAVLTILEQHLIKSASTVSLDQSRIKTKTIAPSFGSAYRRDETIFSVKAVNGGWLMLADVSYRPSITFWVVLILTLFTWVGWIFPLGFFFWQKKVVTQAIKNSFERIKNEFDNVSPDYFAREPAVSTVAMQSIVPVAGSSVTSTAATPGTATPAFSAQPEATLQPEKISPQGNFELDLPPGIKGWSWGGFFLSFIWAIPNRTWIGLLALVPVIGLPVPFILGVKGREWAWRNREWESVAQFQQVQQRWAKWGLVFYIVTFIICAGAWLAPKIFHPADTAIHPFTDAEIAALQSPSPPSPVTPSQPSESPAISGLIFENADHTTPIPTVSGILSKVQKENQDPRLTLNGNVLFNGDDAQWQTPLKRFNLSPQQDVILVSSAGGRGNSCETLFFFLVLTANGNPTWTKEFGTCVSDGSYTQQGNMIELTIPRVGGKTVYTFDGQTLTEDGTPLSSQSMTDDINPAK